MTISVSLAYGASKPVAAVHEGFGPAPMALGAALANKVSVPASSSRPSSRRRDALLKTAHGQALHRAAMHEVGTALDAHGIAPLVALRLRKGFSQKELCERSGLLQPHLSRLENGKVANPDVATLQSIADALQVGLDEVVSATRGQKA